MTSPLDPAFHGLATALAGEFAKELDDLLVAVEARLRTRNLFEEDPPVLPPPRRSDDGGLSLIG